MRLLIALLLGFCLPSVSNAIDLYGTKDCGAIGGSWVNAHAPQRAGSCTLTQAFTLPRNTRLEVGTSVDLILANNGVLTVEGELLIIDTAAVVINGGSLINNSNIDINNDGKLTLNTGNVQNNGVISSEGNITNTNTVPRGQSMGGDIFNHNTIINFHGGEIHNHGRILSIGNGSIRTEAAGVFKNYSGGRYHATTDEIAGRLENLAGGYVSVGRALLVHSGAVLENSGHLDVGYATLTTSKGSQVSMLPGSGLTVGATHQLRGEMIVNGEFSNAGHISLGGTLRSSSTIGEQIRGTNDPIVNAASGVIVVYPTGMISIQDNVLINSAGASVDNGGIISLSCFSKFRDSGQYTGYPISQYCGIPPVVPPTLPKLF